MPAGQLHSILNHSPTGGLVLGLLLLWFSSIKQNQGLQKTALVILMISVALFLATSMTGRAAGKLLDPPPGPLKAAIEDHEQSAGQALFSFGLLAVLSLTGFSRSLRARTLASGFVASILLVGILTAILTAKTAKLGGKIRSTEHTGATHHLV